MSDVILQAVWVAAHHGLRARGRAGDPTMHLWPLVFDIGKALGHPPAPRSR